VEPSDRRPLTSRDRPVFKALASRLARAKVSANAISLLGMVAGLLAGTALVLTSRLPGHERWLWAAAAAFIQLRLLANMLDGMVAIESGTASKVGELYNEIPDRVSDTAALAGLGYAVGGDPILGWAASLAAMFTAYVRTTGKGGGAGSDFGGPMAKPHRMFLATLGSLFCAASPAAWQRVGAWGVPALLLAVILAGSILTALLRLRRIAARLRAAP
jgi:phosphatidylglycerophosphate synthase